MPGCSLISNGAGWSTTVLQTNAGPNGVAGIAADDRVLAYSNADRTAVWRVDLPGTVSRTLDATHGAEWNVVTNGGGGVFWTAYVNDWVDPSYIATDGLDGGMLFQPITGNSNVVANGAGVFLNFQEGPPNGPDQSPGLIRVFPDGGYTRLVIPDANNKLTNLVWLALDANNVYWTPMGDRPAIWMVSQAGGPAWPVASSSGPTVLRTAFFGSAFYWLDANYVANWISIVDGGAGSQGSFDLSSCRDSFSGLTDLAVDASGIYLLLGGPNVVVRVRPDLGTVERVSSSSSVAVTDTAFTAYVKTLAVNSSTVYWVCQVAGAPATVCASQKPH